MDNHRDALASEFADLQQYRGTEQYSAFVKVLGLIEDCYKNDLLTVSKERLERVQGAAEQVRVLRDQLIESREGDVPKI